MKKKAHLMYQHTPFSACGWYVPEHEGMLQTFKVEDTTCKRCLSRLGEYKDNTAKAEAEEREDTGTKYEST